ncbi:replication initiation protein [uncultured Shewanella sp.]|uniref:replication initiation protein n=1 Tax=uncultured Shewanella sp. TaxID=173975 RepID=UPI00260AC81A|nr:replication initiation protein [uncultured Shewanella sp.]
MEEEFEVQTDNIITSADMRDVSRSFFKKAHELVFSQISLTPIQHDIFALFLSKYHKDNWTEFLEKGEISKIPVYKFNTNVLCEWFGLTVNHLATVLVGPCADLSGKKIGCRTHDEFDFIPLFSRVRYRKGQLIISPNHQLVRAYMGASQGHSLVSHQEFRRLKLSSSKRLYTILCRFKNNRMTLHTQPLQDLYGLFGLVDERGKVKKKTYMQTGHFISRIIIPAINEISVVEKNITFHTNETTGSLGFSYEKSGRTIVGIKFLFTWKQEVDKGPALNYQTAIQTYKQLMAIKFCLPPQDELDNAMNFIGKMVLDKELDFNVDVTGFMARYTAATEATLDMLEPT